MTSTIAWLDASREDQRRMREIVNLFSQSESRDELGIGQVRDAFSDLLFPGTSTLHRRARYLLLIPWCYQAAVPRATDIADLERRAAQNERRLIVALNTAGATDDLIGKEALTKLKTLPSALYWSALSQYGIRVGEPSDALAAKRWTSEADEYAERAPRMWNAPPVPAGFPESADRLDLSRDEATWLKERILRGCQNSLLEVLLLSQRDDWFDSPGPWVVPVESSDLSALLRHAELFSVCMNAAALTYNLALGRRYEAAGLTTVRSPVETYTSAIDSWCQDNEQVRRAIMTWDLPDLWSRVRDKNPNIGQLTISFVERWVGLIASDGRPDSDAAIQMVSAREKSQKRGQSRLTNERLLANWTGQSGTRPFDYRWGNVAQTVLDIQDGLADASA